MEMELATSVTRSDTRVPPAPLPDGSRLTYRGRGGVGPDGPWFAPRTTVLRDPPHTGVGGPYVPRSHPVVCGTRLRDPEV